MHVLLIRSRIVLFSGLFLSAEANDWKVAYIHEQD